jgi:hypothetical protein
MHEHSTLCVASTPTIDDVLLVAALGFPVFPLKPTTKQPAIKHWQAHATTDPSTLQDSWQQWPGANIGHVIPRGRLVIDIDPRHGGLTHWKNLLAQHGDLPPTWTAWSGRHDGGFHLYFTVPVTLDIPSAIDLAPGVQVLGFQHNVLLPPSIHPDTQQAYRWDEQLSPLQGCPEAPAPLWVLDVLTKHSRPTRPAPAPTKTQKSARSSSKQGPPPGYLVCSSKAIPFP